GIDVVHLSDRRSLTLPDQTNVTRPDFDLSTPAGQLNSPLDNHQLEAIAVGGHLPSPAHELRGSAPRGRVPAQEIAGAPGEQRDRRGRRAPRGSAAPF